MTLGDHLFGTPGVIGAGVLTGFGWVFGVAYATYEKDEDDEDE